MRFNFVTIKLPLGGKLLNSDREIFGVERTVFWRSNGLCASGADAHIARRYGWMKMGLFEEIG